MDRAKVRANASGGSAAAGGMNFHARVAAVAAVHLLGHRRLGWLKEMDVDIPIDIWCETNGPGDDLRFVLANHLVVEAQVKKGLKRGEDLWIALESLATGIHMGDITYGVLVIDIDIDIDASLTIRRGLAQGIVRLGEGRADFIDEITEQFVYRLDKAELPVQDGCRKLRIVVMHCADRDDVSEVAAKDELRRLCTDAHNVENAWTAIQLSAHGLIERKGRWSAHELSGVLKTANIELQAMPVQDQLLTICGRVWENLDEANHYQGFIQSFRQHYLVSDQMAAQPFGGRDSECQQFDVWLSDTKAPSRKLISAPTARGKSALLVQ